MRGSIVSQSSLNRLYRGQEFEIEKRMPVILNTLFTTMLYCGGIPLLLPCAACAFLLTYCVDKLTFLRLYRVPPQYDAGAPAIHENHMPYTTIIYDSPK